MTKHRPYLSLKHWREANGLSQQAAAQQCGVSQTYYSRLERNVQAPRPKKAKTISEATGVPLEAVLGIAS